VTVLTGEFGARVLGPLLAGRPDTRVLAIENRFFGGTIGVAGLLTGADVGRVLEHEPADQRYLLPDACLSKGVFLDGTSLDDLPRAVEVVPTDGLSLRRALDGVPAR
jgi:NifB/MoaA-like Fe-S oxidoreductase